MVKNILEKYKNLVWPEIQKYLTNPIFPQAFLIPQKYQKLSNFHWQLSSEYPLRQGKYLRPTLLLLTCEAMNGKAQKALKTAAAMQISEDWLLIHDDFEDDSDQRRGKPALHRIYGNELAVNAGDTLHILMWKILFDNYPILGSQKTQEILEEFYRILSRTALGQTAELKWMKEEKFDFTDEEWFFIGDGKTSYYSIAGPMRLGAIIAGVNKTQLEKLAGFGLLLGRSFQLIDDILDVTSNFEGQKKQKGNDIYENKKTVILGHLLRTLKGTDKGKLIKILKKDRPEKSQKEINWVIRAMEKARSIKYAQNLALKFKKEALEIFEKDLKFLSTSPARENLREIIDFIVERKY